MDKPSAARRFAGTVKAKVSNLQRVPESGRPVPEFPGSGLRELLIGNYRVIYRVLTAPAQVQILTVRHGARLLDEEIGKQHDETL
jgi:plasmid stabilization system protein ParE